MKFDRITIEPGKMNGQPCIRGYRLTVRRVLDIVATYKTADAWKKDYPDLEAEDAEQALRFAAEALDESVDWEELAAAK
jgi:uncharacterized protein (DUF433 family)